MPRTESPTKAIPAFGPDIAVSAVLWDIDGTLLTSGGVMGRIFLDAVEAICGTRPDHRSIDFGGRLDPEIAALLIEAAGGHDAQVGPVLEYYEVLVSQQRDDLSGHVRVLPGVRELVTALAEADVLQTVVTGNLSSVGHLKMAAAELAPPIDLSVGGFGASGVDRTAVAQSSLNLLADAGWRAPLDTCWVIGDTPRDLACARALGLRCALVATGHHDAESLSRLGADLVLTALTEHDRLRTTWFA